jgi:hypothetical protein
MVEHVEVLVEEPSMDAFLRALLPRIIGEISFEIYRHRCKADLLERLPQRLRGYASWLPTDWRVVVVVDRDDDDCRQLKRRLERIAQDAGVMTRSRARGRDYALVNRLAIEELEAWYFGDWTAVRVAYPRVSVSVPRRAAYRDPDAIRGGTWEAFERELRRAGYFVGGLEKIEAARSIGPHVEPGRNSSCSFRVFLEALTEIATA